ncbi:MAG: hypothetical protein IPK15_27265 [Verrucomicrobia bacterium]|jgi:hypothetical protein|nr:hypothetical protein [Verrucomicrobiota bacterium]
MKTTPEIPAEKTGTPVTSRFPRAAWFDAPMRALLNNDAFRNACARSAKRRSASR